MTQKTKYQTASRVIKLGNAVTWIKNYKTQFTDLTSTQSDAIIYILKNAEDKDITASDLMDELMLSQSTVAGIIQRLESKGLITRITAENDNRKSIIKPTKKGTELDKALIRQAQETENILLDGMTEDEQKMFIDLMQRALNNANAFREKEGNIK